MTAQRMQCGFSMTKVEGRYLRVWTFERSEALLGVGCWDSGALAEMKKC